MNAVISLIAMTSISFGQHPNTWHELTLGASSPDDAVSILGRPTKDKGDQKLYADIGNWVDKKARYRKLEFHKLEGMKKVNLYFREKALAAIELELEEKVNPNSLGEAYGVDFIPKIGSLAKAADPSTFERQNGRTFPKRYPLTYNLVAVSDNAFVVAQVQQGVFAEFGKSMAGAEDEEMSFPGSVWKIQLIARGEQDRKGLDALK
ncbi:MAG: hypothetical protein P8Y94_07840 [Acidobacteriota bacterium]